MQSYIKIVTKKYETIILDTDLNVYRLDRDSDIYKFFENIFEEWFEDMTSEGSALGKDIEFCYYGYYDEPALYSKHGAICQSIEDVIDICVEKNIIWISEAALYTECDITASFQI
jgi:hypothetical protein